MSACLAQSRVHSQALHVVLNPGLYATCPGLRLLAWAALMSARGCRVNQARLGRITPRLPLEPDDAAYLAPRLAAIRAAEALVGRPDDGCPGWLDALIDAAPDEAAP